MCTCVDIRPSPQTDVLVSVSKTFGDRAPPPEFSGTAYREFPNDIEALTTMVNDKANHRCDVPSERS